MCSSPNGSRAKPHVRTHFDTTFEDMSAVQYSDMVRRANESYEQRQEELAELRKHRPQVQPVVNTEAAAMSLMSKIKTLLNHQLQLSNAFFYNIRHSK